MRKIYNIITSKTLIILFLIVLQALFIALVFNYVRSLYIYIQLTYALISLFLIFEISFSQKQSGYKLMWVIIIIALQFVGIITYICLKDKKLSEKQLKYYKSKYYKDFKIKNFNHIENENNFLSVSYKNINNFISNANYYNVSANNNLKYYSVGQDYFNDLLKSVNKAEKYIFLEFFIISNGTIWNNLYDIICEKAKNNVKVYLIYDDLGSKDKISYNFVKTMRKHNIICYKFNKFYANIFTKHNNRDHRKLAVIDGKIAYIGGINIGDEYANITKPYKYWKDSALSIKGSAVNDYIAMYIQIFNACAKNPLNINDFIYYDCNEKIKNINKNYIQAFADGPKLIYNEYITKNIFIDLIFSSSNYLYIMTPYFVIDEYIAQALRVCALKNVKIKIIIPRIPDKKSVYLLTKSNAKKLLKYGVEVYEYEKGFIHSKVILSDDRIGYVGSANFDFRSFNYNYECGVILYGCGVLMDIKNDFEKTYRYEGIKMTDDNAKLKLKDRLKVGLLNLFSPLL